MGLIARRAVLTEVGVAAVNAGFSALLDEEELAFGAVVDGSRLACTLMGAVRIELVALEAVEGPASLALSLAEAVLRDVSPVDTVPRWDVLAGRRTVGATASEGFELEEVASVA